MRTAKRKSLIFVCERCSHEWADEATGRLGARHWCPVCHRGRGEFKSAARQREAAGGG
jgi:rubrerythrin